MSLSDAYESLEEAEAFPQCKTCRWYIKLDTHDKAFFDDKVDDPNINHRRLLRACKGCGLDCVSSSFINHIQYHHDKIRDER